MTFEEILDQAIAMLQRRGRLTYGTLQRQFQLDDAALVDGASRFGALVRVLLPLARPGMIVAAIFGVIFIWNEFLVGLYVITSPDKQTVPIGASALLTTQSPVDWNIAAGVGVLTTIPILIFSIFVQRYIVRGMTAGAIR